MKFLLKIESNYKLRLTWKSETFFLLDNTKSSENRIEDRTSETFSWTKWNITEVPICYQENTKKFPPKINLETLLTESTI